MMNDLIIACWIKTTGLINLSLCSENWTEFLLAEQSLVMHDDHSCVNDFNDTGIWLKFLIASPAIAGMKVTGMGVFENLITALCSLIEPNACKIKGFVLECVFIVLSCLMLLLMYCRCLKGCSACQSNNCTCTDRTGLKCFQIVLPNEIANFSLLRIKLTGFNFLGNLCSWAREAWPVHAGVGWHW